MCRLAPLENIQTFFVVLWSLDMHFHTLSRQFFVCLVPNQKSSACVLFATPRMFNSFPGHFTMVFWSAIDNGTELRTNVLHQGELMFKVA